ncbi:methyltransferase domain-containing protein [Halobacillus locisalis]|uniref:Methyltransferase domain-containing protein n=1 Tax=Halobacillus locisalis TaxID=220753 RepID=A0A838CPL3_9BACI|nr:MerR family transcriptional regulator [Halobacillus locisalis]MBA2173779.1 methyltransferase domain-containing protein [Halobacillus locisalis]
MQMKEIASLVHTTPRTIRFYEEKGLISPYKSANHYRQFDEGHVEKLRVILALREVGMSTSQIRETLEDQHAIDHHLNRQRSVLYSEWLEMKDMITTIDEMVKSCDKASHSLYEKASILKDLKKKRKRWHDRWNFDSQADSYDRDLKTEGYGFNIHAHYEEVLAEAVRLIDAGMGEVGADIGIGTGNLGSQFLSKGVSVIGVDQSNEMLQKCSEKFPSIDVRNGHFLALPLMDQSVDFITTSYALHHVEEEEKQLAVEEMDRVLAHRGRIVIADLMFENEADRKRVLEKLASEGNLEAVRAIEDEWYANRSQLIHALEQLGYIVSVHQYSDILHLVYAEKE